MAQDSIRDCHATSCGIDAYYNSIAELVSRDDSDSFRRREQDFSRSGPLSPEILVTLLLYLVADAGRRGYQPLLDAFWDECRTFDLALPTEQPVSASAFCQARMKVEPDLIRRLLHDRAESFDSQHGLDFRLKGHRVIACDGSKVSVRRSDELWDALGGPEGGHCPQMLLSTLYDVLSGVPIDVRVAPTDCSERAELLAMLDHLHPGDILVLDRGYPSFEVLQELLRRGIHFVIRNPARCTFKPVERFLEDGETDGIVELCPPGRPHATEESVRVRIHVAHRDGLPPLIVLTDLPPEEFTGTELQEVYRSRWAVEEFYKVGKGDYLGQGQFHAMTLQGLKQEVYAFALYIALTRQLTASAATAAGTSPRRISQKGSILAVAAYLTRLLLEQRPDEYEHILDRLFDRIARNAAKARPGRSYPRRSYKPTPRWGSAGRRA